MTIKSDFKLFHFFKFATETPLWFEAILESESEFDDDDEEYELPLLTANLLPGYISVVSSPFQSINFFTVVPCLDAMPLNVSPLLTVYVFLLELLLDLLLLELLDDLFVSITSPGWIRSPFKPFNDFSLETVVSYLCAIFHNESPLSTLCDAA